MRERERLGRANDRKTVCQVDETHRYRIRDRNSEETVREMEEKRDT